MIRRLLGCALVLGVFALFAVGLGVWMLRETKPAMPALQGDLRSSNLTVNGRQRSFSFYVPRGLRPDPPLLIVLHGSMMNGRQMRATTAYAFDEIADREGLLVAYPDGLGGHWNDCRRVGDYEAKRLGIDDVAFLKSVTEWFRREHEVSSVFATGLSNGAQMSYRLALEAPDLVRGIAPIAASLPAPDNQSCIPAGRPVATMIVNGTDDPLNPYQGGRVALFGLFLQRGNVVSTLESATYWAKLAGHGSRPTVQEIPDSDSRDGAKATRHQWGSDDGKPAVALIVVNGGGHTVPHPKLRTRRLLGRTCRDFSSPEEIWKFFAVELKRVSG